MVRAQDWLNKEYPLPERSKVISLNISSKSLEGSLNLEGFTSLKELNCSFNELTDLQIVNNPSLEAVRIQYNRLSKLNLQEFPNLKVLISNNNNLTSLDLSKNEKLERLNVMDNNFSEQDLSFLRHLVSLKDLRLGNWNKERIEKSEYNRLQGSLESLKDANELERLDIRNTNISKGLEYLPDSVEFFCCQPDLIENSRVREIFNIFKNEQGEVKLLSDITNSGYIEKEVFKEKIQAHKKNALNTARNTAVEAVNDHWNAHRIMPDNTVNGRTKEDILTPTWEGSLRSQETIERANTQKDSLISLINTERDKVRARELLKDELQNKVQEIEQLKNQNSQFQTQNKEKEEQAKNLTTRLLDKLKKDLNVRLDDFRTNLSVQKSELQTKYGVHNYQQILDKSLTLNNLEQLENTIRAVICICATEIINQEVKDNKKTNPNKTRALLADLNLIKTAWSQTASEISKENNPLYLEVIDRQSERQQVEDLIKDLQKQESQTPVLEDLSAIKQKAKQDIDKALVEASLSETDIISDHQGYAEKIEKLNDSQAVKDFVQTMIAYIGRQKVAHQELREALKNATEVSNEGKNEEEGIFEKRRLARLNLENFAELTSSEAKQAYQSINKDGEVNNYIKILAEKLWNYLEANEKKADDPENKDFLEALTSKEKERPGIEKGTEKYKLYWIIQQMYKEFVKSHLDDKKWIKFYPYTNTPNTYGHTSPIIITKTKSNSKGGITSSTVSLEGFDLYINFKNSELQILSTFAHEISHNVVGLNEHKGLIPSGQSHSKSFWENLYVNDDSTLAYLTSCLPVEKQKELKVLADILKDPKITDLHYIYSPESGDLKDKTIIKGYFEEDINEKWITARQSILNINDSSMNEDPKNWENQEEKDKRWFKAIAFHKSRYLPEAGKGKKAHKIYILYDEKVAPQGLKESIEKEFSLEKGWEAKEAIKGYELEVLCQLEASGDHVECGYGKENISKETPQQEAQIIQSPLGNTNK